jgi:ribosomal protein S21
MAKIKVRHGESLEQALKRFNNEVKKHKILENYKDRERHTKRSEVKRRKKKELARKIWLEGRRNRG